MTFLDSALLCKYNKLNHFSSQFQVDCQNYIRVLVKLDHLEHNREELLVCGTNAYNPMCRHYLINGFDALASVEKEFSGRGFCPYDPRHNSTYIYAGKLSKKSDS